MTHLFTRNDNSKNTILTVFLSTVFYGGIALSGAIAYRMMGTSEAVKPQPVVATPVVLQAVTALGRVEPEGQVIQVFPPSSTESARIQQLRVQQGDWVKAGQALAVLDNYTRRLATVNMALEEVRVAQARLMQVRAGAKQGDLQAQQAAIARLEAELKNAQMEESRYRSLYHEGAVSASQYDSKRLGMEAAQRQVNQARASLNSLAEVRPVDVQLSLAEVKQAKAKVVQAQAELALSVVRSPRTGQIIKVQTFPGEMVGTKGIVSLGNTMQMVVVAEVYETDIPKIHLGQTATITSPSLTKPLFGKVSQVGLEIGKRDVLDTDAATDVDAHVVEVKILLNRENSRVVAGMTNLKVDVSIGLKE
ncbi:MAG: ABC exporter membrane fusion protein [Nostoc sp. DedVER02]|uniref:ABC exporter membrane fusion protein n=1 Tax=unclassified Nostoc TaxID=2593658 RepID=UPI002AD54F97|nr:MULTISPECIES: ABC exporter membrane fusion protein [unclassified Nostoc]MDZ7984829.1 ABC exporter membrane fusion protein [Nostoc sp. DedVER02]MDZ8113627.1 ABC exporter membrane fusion protein [Nostoc sp. DedVER01b]